MKYPLILASKSPRRIEILKNEKIKFQVKPSKIKEISFFKKPHLIVKDLAFKKALFIAKNYPANPILAADTIVYCDKKVIGKPKNTKDALKLLRMQNGKWQSVYTGVALIWLKKGFFFCEFDKSKCLAKKLSSKELKKLAKKHRDKAGAYAIQDMDDFFIRKIIGRFDNVVGLPMNIVKKFLKKIKYLKK